MLRPKKYSLSDKNIPIIPLKECLAKTIHCESGDKPGVSVETHCRIVGYVARELISRMPAWLRDSLFPNGSELIAAAHDVGKISPTFQEKIYRGIKKLGIINPELDATIGYHFTVGQAATAQCPKYISEIIGKHHGVRPQNVQNSEAEIYGGKDWQKQRLELLQILKKDLCADWPEVTSALQADVLAGMTVVADWIGSGSAFDTVKPDGFMNDVAGALNRAGFISPRVRRGLTFNDIFHFSPRDIQTRLFDVLNGSGVYVLEAPMGLGKTEAALYAAYKALEENFAMGIYFALPTQLTSDKVYERMNDFLTNVLEKSDNGLNALLLHSAVWLRNTELGEDGSPGHSWFNSAKRGLLAPFAVGTIDQALMSVMNVKHGFVRTFGLAGKVVILDEVHSYDNYTGTILKELVAALRQLHCTVIILSATLTNKQRFALMGLNRDVYAQTRHSAYPLISAHIKNVFKETATKKINNVTVNVCLTHKDTDALEETLKRSERGEQVLWIENTVQDAQERYCQLAARSAEINVDCGLLHSRFIKTDRNRNEKKWVDVFGAMGRNIRQTKGRILVGTQVLEQSLDIDADFIVMRLCPTDMLFQRIGRLWRHRENDRIRSPQSRREAWILAPRLDNVISGEDSFGKSAKVYSPYILCRTLEVWNSLLIVGVPNDIRLLLEKTYADREESGVLAEFKRKTDEKRDNLHRFALSSISIGGITLPESKATTRYSEMESTEVLLIRKKVQQHNKVILKLLDGSEIELPKFANVVQRRNIASIILSNIVTVPEYLAPDVATKQLGWLKDYVYLGDGKENPFRVAIIADSGDLRGIDETKASINYDLNYDACLGYRATKKKGFCDGAGE